MTWLQKGDLVYDFEIEKTIKYYKKQMHLHKPTSQLSSPDIQITIELAGLASLDEETMAEQNRGNNNNNNN